MISKLHRIYNNMVTTAFYAVAKGRTPGVYTTWTEAKAQVDGFKFPKYRKFATREEATQFVMENGEKKEDKNVEKTDKHDVVREGLVVFTDGSAIGNGSRTAKAGYAVVWPNHPHLTQGRELIEGAKTNNRAEFMAAITAIELADTVDPERNDTLHIYTDSMLLINTAMKWRAAWKRKGWKKADGQEVMNKDLVIRLDSLLETRKVEWYHVEAHTGRDDWKSVWNAKVDELAQKSAR